MELVNLDRYEKEIVAGKRRGLLGAIQIGMALEKIREGNLWVSTGAKSFEKYAAGCHGFGRSTVYNMIGVAKAFGKYIIENPDLQGIEVTRLIKLLPHVKKSNEMDLLSQAAHIPDSEGFDNQIRNMKGQVATDDDHPHTWEPFLEKCSVCGKTKRFRER